MHFGEKLPESRVVGGNGKSALVCAVELKGLMKFPIRLAINAKNINILNLSQSD